MLISMESYHWNIYIIDADVNSLYQAAMKNEFSTGFPIHLKPNAPSVKYLTK
jgi:hypothetical protein